MNTFKKTSNIKNVNSWSPNSWRSLKISQQPVYKDNQQLESVISKITSLPGIVNAKEIVELKSKLSLCHEENCFIIQVGDCAERFQDATDEIIQRNHILTYHLKKAIVIIGRIAGQYAKPRSNDYEMINNEKIDVFRGEIVNDITPCSQKRVPDPERMLQAYYNSTITINKIKDWNFYGDKSIENFKKIYSDNIYEVQSENFIKKLIHYYDNFPELINIENSKVYCSHEGLLLNYEECFIRKVENVYYDLSCHFLWIGERTRNLDEAHVEFFRGIGNPVGIKTGPRANLDELVEVIKLINPENEKGKIVIITRFGNELCESCVDSLAEKIKASDLNVIFMCDPNHGNTKVHIESSKKVRYFEELTDEIIITHKTLKKNGLFLSGIHLEASSFNVTECLGGIDNEVTNILDECYTTYCDPRLNKLQTMELCDYIGTVISEEGIDEERFIGNKRNLKI